MTTDLNTASRHPSNQTANRTSVRVYQILRNTPRGTA